MNTEELNEIELVNEITELDKLITSKLDQLPFALYQADFIGGNGIPT